MRKPCESGVESAVEIDVEKRRRKSDAESNVRKTAVLVDRKYAYWILYPRSGVVLGYRDINSDQ